MKSKTVEMNPQSIVVVEGKSDRAKLQKIYGSELKVIETSGMGLNDQILNSLRVLAKDHPIIIFTDPDGPGKRIRETILQKVEGNIQNAFISKQAIKGQKIGVAEADEQAIKEALSHLLTFDQKNVSLTWSEYLKNNYYQVANRQKICAYYHFDPQIRNKTLFKWLNWMNLSVPEIETILGRKELNNGKNNR